MNYSLASLLLSDDVRAVQVVFYPTGNDHTRYTYKTVEKDLKEGDLVLVQVAKSASKSSPSSNRFGLTVARVISTEAEVDFQNSEIEYKWVLGKIDLESFDHVLENEKKLIERVKQTELRTKREQLRRAMNLEGITEVNLLEHPSYQPQESSPPTSEEDDETPPVDNPKPDPRKDHTLLVLARSYADYRRLVDDGTLPRNSFYLSSQEQLQGMRGGKYTLVPEWSYNTKYPEHGTLRQLHARGFTEIPFDKFVQAQGQEGPLLKFSEAEKPKVDG